MLAIFCFILELFVIFLLSKHLSIELSKLFYRLTHHEKASGLILSFLFLPGTLIHELSHYLMAVLVRVKVHSFTLLPQIGSDNIVLGSVGITQPDPFRKFLIGVAPFLLGTTFLLLSINFFFSQNISFFSPLALIFFYGIFTVSNTMFSSKADLEGTLELLLILFLLITILYVLGFRFPDLTPNLMPYVPFFEKADKILLIPASLDMLFFAILKTLNFF